ncbi:hypothetical protein AAF463_24915 (plasmid) [Pantoea sp. BJ2]|uniref:Uncharacterized protein n=1 Tax=Pantoea sp. BJ2 TaxID=3141322 RepID=A0AAU7U3Y4_9GAMM
MMLQDVLIAKTTAEIQRHHAMASECNTVLEQAKHHLDSLTISGMTSLADIFDVKKKQGTAKRQIAEVVMRVEEHYKKIEELEITIANARRKRTALEKRKDKLSLRLSALNRKSNLIMLNQQDNDTEERINWTKS